jgi:hypothetical protein
MRKRTRALLGSLAAAAFVAFAPTGANADTYWQCVPFARLLSGIQIFGDAWTWWQQAAGKYETGFQPKAGAVLCFKPTARMRSGPCGRGQPGADRPRHPDHPRQLEPDRRLARQGREGRHHHRRLAGR